MPGPMGGPGRGPVGVPPKVKDFKNTTKKLISNYLSKIEKEKKSSLKANRKMESTYKRLRAICVFLGVLLFFSFLVIFQSLSVCYQCRLVQSRFRRPRYLSHR